MRAIWIKWEHLLLSRVREYFYNGLKSLHGKSALSPPVRIEIVVVSFLLCDAHNNPTSKRYKLQLLSLFVSTDILWLHIEIKCVAMLQMNMKYVNKNRKKNAINLKTRSYMRLYLACTGAVKTLKYSLIPYTCRHHRGNKTTKILPHSERNNNSSTKRCNFLLSVSVSHLRHHAHTLHNAHIQR